MIDLNELRRLAKAATPGPWMIDYVGVGFEVAAGESVIAQSQQVQGDRHHKARKANATFIAAANPAAITELLDRLEAAESDGLEQARLNGMGGEREAALLARLEAAEKERDKLRAEAIYWKEQKEPGAAGWRAIAWRLRAKIERMERQEPVKHEFQGRDGAWHSFIDQRHYENTVADGTWPIRSLYALPGAQPAPSVPEGWKLVPIEPTQEMRDAWTDNMHEAFKVSYQAMLNAAPKTESE